MEDEAHIGSGNLVSALEGLEDDFLTGEDVTIEQIHNLSTTPPSSLHPGAKLGLTNASPTLPLPSFGGLGDDSSTDTPLALGVSPSASTSSRSSAAPPPVPPLPHTKSSPQARPVSFTPEAKKPKKSAPLPRVAMLSKPPPKKVEEAKSAPFRGGAQGARRTPTPSSMGRSPSATQRQISSPAGGARGSLPDSTAGARAPISRAQTTSRLPSPSNSNPAAGAAAASSSRPSFGSPSQIPRRASEPIPTAASTTRVPSPLGKGPSGIARTPSRAPSSGSRGPGATGRTSSIPRPSGGPRQAASPTLSRKKSSQSEGPDTPVRATLEELMGELAAVKKELGIEHGEGEGEGGAEGTVEATTKEGDELETSPMSENAYPRDFNDGGARRRSSSGEAGAAVEAGERRDESSSAGPEVAAASEAAVEVAPVPPRDSAVETIKQMQLPTVPYPDEEDEPVKKKAICACSIM